MIVFVDVETTGLEERAGHLLEVALVVTDDELREVGFITLIIKPEGDWQALMDDYVRAMHTKNELLLAVESIGRPRAEVESKLVAFVQQVFVDVPGVPTHKCEKCGKNEKEHFGRGAPFENIPKNFCDASPPWGNQGVEFIEDPQFAPKMDPALKHTPFAGSTVGFDRRWLHEHVPALEKLLSYRSIDVSSITELARRWAPAIYDGRPGAKLTKEEQPHRALEDVRESIAYLRYYRARGFIGSAP